MKPKKIEKRLVLSKITISNLNLDDMLEIKAGADDSGIETCPTMVAICRSEDPAHCYTINVTCVTICVVCPEID